MNINEMGRTYSTHGKEGHAGVWWENLGLISNTRISRTINIVQCNICVIIQTLPWVFREIL